MTTALALPAPRLAAPPDFVLLSPEELRQASGGAWLPHAAVTALRVAVVIGGIGGGIGLVAFGVGMAVGYYAHKNK